MTGFEMIEQLMKPESLELAAVYIEMTDLEDHVLELMAELIERGIDHG